MVDCMNESSKNTELRTEVDKNYQYFKSKLNEWIENYSGKFVVIRSQKEQMFLDTFDDARKYAIDKFKDGIFSIQEITTRNVDLGYISANLKSI